MRKITPSQPTTNKRDGENIAGLSHGLADQPQSLQISEALAAEIIAV